MTFSLLLYLVTISIVFSGCVASVGHLKTNQFVYADVLPLTNLHTNQGGGVIEPGRLLNILLGFVVILGFLLVNTFALLALGLAVGPTVQKSTVRKSRYINQSLAIVKIERFFDMLFAYEVKKYRIKQ